MASKVASKKGGATKKKVIKKKTAAKKPVKKAVKKSAAKKTVKKVVKKTVKKIVKKIVRKPAPKAAVKKSAPKNNKVVSVPKPLSFDRNRVEVVEIGTNSFVLIIGSARNFFALDEMRRLVKVCHESPSEGEAKVRLYTWLSLNRKDVLIDSQISGMGDPNLGTVYRYLISHYTAKE